MPNNIVEKDVIKNTYDQIMQIYEKLYLIKMKTIKEQTFYSKAKRLLTDLQPFAFEGTESSYALSQEEKENLPRLLDDAKNFIEQSRYLQALRKYILDKSLLLRLEKLQTTVDCPDLQNKVNLNIKQLHDLQNVKFDMMSNKIPSILSNLDQQLQMVEEFITTCENEIREKISVATYESSSQELSEADLTLSESSVSSNEDFIQVKTYSDQEVRDQLRAPRTYEDGKDFYSKNGRGEKTFDLIELKESLVLSDDYNNMGTGKNNLAHLAIMNDDKKFYNRLVQIMGSEDHKFFHTKNSEGKTPYQLKMPKEPYSVRLWVLASCCAEVPILGAPPFWVLGIASLICKAAEAIKEKVILSKQSPSTQKSDGKHSVKVEGAFLGKFSDLHTNFAPVIPQP